MSFINVCVFFVSKVHLCEIENPQDLPNLEFPFNVRKGRPLLVAVKILRPDASKNARLVSNTRFTASLPVFTAQLLFHTFSYVQQTAALPLSALFLKYQTGFSKTEQIYYLDTKMYKMAPHILASVIFSFFSGITIRV